MDQISITAETDCEERKPVRKLLWIENAAGINDHWCRHSVDEIVRREPLELFPLSQNDTAVRSCETFRNRGRVQKRFKAGLTHLLDHWIKCADLRTCVEEVRGNFE